MGLSEVAGELEKRAGIRVHAARAATVSGGSINRAYRVPSDKGPLFVKTNHERLADAFEAESEGLQALRDSKGVAVPEPLAHGVVAGTAYLALEWIELSGRTVEAEERLGKDLARQHRAKAETFGWHRDNTIGSTPQPNTKRADWIEFFAEVRLGFQLELAARRGLPRAQLADGKRLIERLDGFFEDYAPEPSLLHGDLWSGNWGADASGLPYIFDPAVYYGDREADLAMTRLFGGFGGAFYAAYEAAWPLADGWKARVDLYNLYHVLNHFNLFGAGYLGQTADTLTRLLRHCA